MELLDVEYYRDLEIGMGQRSLKVIEISTIRKLGWGFHFPIRLL